MSLADFEAFVTRVTRVDPDVSDETGIDHIAALERLKAACAAGQARLTAQIHAHQTARDRARHIDRAQTARSVGTQIALARKQTPQRGNQHLGLALALTHEMPCTLEALTGGRISEWQATLLVRATACLSAEDRGRVDTELAPRMGTLSDRRLEAAARAAAARLDPASVAARRRRAEGDRRVTVRPAPDTMTHLTGLLPVKDGVACYAALTAAADAARAAGDTRSRGQVMADTLTARVTGRQAAEGPDVEINLIMPTDTFLGYGKTPGWVPDYGPIPADLASWWAHGSSGTAEAGSATSSNAGSDADQVGRQRAKRFIRRLFATPDMNRLVGWGYRPLAGERVGGANIRGCSRNSWSFATRRAVLPAATRRSGIWTTSPGTPTAARPPRPTDKACANTATTSKTIRTGRSPVDLTPTNHRHAIPEGPA